MFSVLTILVVIVKVIVSFSALIMIHEFGHFIVAKLSGVWVEEYGLGLPPRIIGKKIGDTIYSINLLPIGGFVKLHGETGGDTILYPEKAFTKKRKMTRIVITLAGIVMNFILAVAAFGVIYFITGIPGKVDLTILKVNSGSPAYTAGILPNDIIEKVNGIVVTKDIDFKSEIDSLKGQVVLLTLLRKGKEVTLSVRPRVVPPPNEGSLGVEFTDIQETYFPPILVRPFAAAWYGMKETFDLSKAVIFGLGGALSSVEHGQTPKGLVGVVGIFSLFVEFAKLGILPIINLVGVVSVNLAIINIIPFPPLDGSRIALVIAEWVTKRKLTAKLEERIYLVGFIILIGLTILITSHELPALVKAGGIGNYANSLLNPK